MSKRTPGPEYGTPVEYITSGLGPNLPFEDANNRAHPDHIRRHTPARCKEQRRKR